MVETVVLLRLSLFCVQIPAARHAPERIHAMMLWTAVFFCAGIVLLVWGADLLVRGAAHLAAAAGISPLIIGLTIVAMGTSAPELAVSLQAALAGQASLTLGNVLGSNIANILLILGLAALVAPLLVAPRLLKREVPAMIGISAVVWLLAADGTLNRLDGAILVTLLAAFLGAIITSARKEPPTAMTMAQPLRGRWGMLGNLGLVLGGLILLVAGAQWLVDGAVVFARAFGISELIIGLTVVAVGTSLPEIATSILASLRGERDIAVGNVVGSNILNLLAVLGMTTLLAPQPIAVPASVLSFDLPVMVATAVACLPIFVTGKLIARWEAALFLGYYVAYTTYLLLMAAGHEGLPIFSTAMLLFVIPLTVITLTVVLIRHEHQQRKQAQEAT